MMGLVSVSLLSLLLLPAVQATGYPVYPPGFTDSTRAYFSIGDDITLTCPVSLCPGEEYKSVEWIYWSCGRYHFKFCYTRLSSPLPSDASLKPTVNISNISCEQQGFYHCKVEGTRGTKEEHLIDVSLSKDSSLKPQLYPGSLTLRPDVTGPIQIACVDQAYVPGSSIRMYYGVWGWRASFHEVPTKCTIDYTPGTCQEAAHCSGTFDRERLVTHQTLANSVHCDITRPGGKRVITMMRVNVDRTP